MDYYFVLIFYNMAAGVRDTKCFNHVRVYFIQHDHCLYTTRCFTYIYNCYIAETYKMIE